MGELIFNMKIKVYQYFRKEIENEKNCANFKGNKNTQYIKGKKSQYKIDGMEGLNLSGHSQDNKIKVYSVFQ